MLAAAALLTGFVKTGLPSLAIVLPGLMALSFPAKESVGALLLYLLAGDVMAICCYRKAADVREVLRLLPWVALGIAAGAVILSEISDGRLKTVLGCMVVGLAAVEVLRCKSDAGSDSLILRGAVGVGAGVATTIGNAAGPIMGIYFLLMRLDKTRFLGTTALFFLIVNSSKIPIFVHFGMIRRQYLPAFLWTVPLVGVGALAGRLFLRRVSTAFFHKLILILTILAGVLLLLS